VGQTKEIIKEKWGRKKGLSQPKALEPSQIFPAFLKRGIKGFSLRLVNVSGVK
jgi:hypothetical protein